MLELWTAAFAEQTPRDLTERINRFRRQVDASERGAGGDAPFVEGVTYVTASAGAGAVLVAFVDYFAEEKLMPE